MKKAMIALAALAFMGTAIAGPNWTYVDAGYTRASSGEGVTDGFLLRGSIGFMEMWQARVEYVDGQIDGGSPPGEDYDGYLLAIGAHPAVSDSTDLVLEIGLFDGDVKDGGGTTGTDGYSLTAGLRSMWTDNLELNAFVSTVDASVDGCGSCDSTSVVVQAGGQYLFTDNLGVGVDVANGGGSGSVANFYVRYGF